VRRVCGIFAKTYADKVLHLVTEKCNGKDTGRSVHIVKSNCDKVNFGNDDIQVNNNNNNKIGVNTTLRVCWNRHMSSCESKHRSFY